MLKYLKNYIVAAGVLLCVCVNVCAETVNSDGLSPISQMVISSYLISYFSFFLIAFLIFATAYKRGAFRDHEKGKYYMLTINEPDYYTPDWAKEETENESANPDREHD